MKRPPWEDVYTKYVNYIKFAASQTYYKYRSVEPEDLFQEGQLVMYRCWLLYGNKSESDFKSMMTASVWRKLKDLSKKRRIYGTDLDTLQEYGIEPSQEYDWDTPMDIEDKLQQVANLLIDEPIALTLLREYVNPSPRTIWEAKMDLERKAMIKAQGANIAVPSSVQSSKRAIRRAMGLSQAKFDIHFRILKRAMCKVYYPDQYDEYYGDVQMEQEPMEDQAPMQAVGQALY